MTLLMITLLICIGCFFAEYDDGWSGR